MKTWVYLSRDGERYLIYHRNVSNRTWVHPYSEKGTCGACLGTSTAAPEDLSTSKRTDVDDATKGG